MHNISHARGTTNVVPKSIYSICRKLDKIDTNLDKIDERLVKMNQTLISIMDLFYVIFSKCGFVSCYSTDRGTTFVVPMIIYAYCRQHQR